MPEPDVGSAPSRARRPISIILLIVLVTTCALVLILGLQAARGEKRDHFGTFADEASHYLTALMIRDYVAGGFPGSPVKFGLNYYIHRPKVAFGVWPPLFHISLAAWMLVFPVSAPSVLFFTSLIGALLVGLFFAFVRREFSLRQSLAMATAVALAPQLHELSSMVMADTLHALACMCAMFSLSIYLERRRAVWVLAAGLATVLAFFTKNNAVLLAIAIPLTIVLSRAWWIVWRRAAWAAAAMVAVLVGGWELWAMRWVLDLVSHTTTLPEAIRFYSLALVSVAGAPVLLLALVGGAFAVVGAVKKQAPVRPIFAASISLIVGTWLFHVVLPQVTNARYLLPVVPAAVILAAHGIEALALRLQGRFRPRLVSALVWVGLLGAQAYGAMHAPILDDSAFPLVSQFVLSHIPAGANGVVLVSSDRNGEGALIAEVASREPQPALWLLRASKVLSHSGWFSEGYQVRFKSDDEVLQYLDSVPVEMIVVDSPSSYHREHHAQLRAVIAAHPERFSLLLRTEANQRCRGPYCEVEVYRCQMADGPRSPQLNVDAKKMIGRKLFDDWKVDAATQLGPR